MKRPDAYVTLGERYFPQVRVPTPLLYVAAGVAIFTAGMAAGEFLYILTHR